MQPWAFSDIWTLGEPFWLPKGVTWELVLRTDGKGTKPLPRHYIYVITLTAGFLLLRYLISRFVFRPIGKFYQINDRVTPAPEANALGEKLFKESRGRAANEEQIGALMSAAGWSERRAQRWFRQRSLSALPNKMVKFTDSCWRAMAYIAMLCVGCSVVPFKTYFYDVEDCWRTYPNRYIDADEFWYYMLEMSFYLSLTVSHCFEQRKKDFWEMLIHHIATLGLISLSFSVNYTPIGALIMLCHDIADPWLELAKLIGYTRHKRELDSDYTKNKSEPRSPYLKNKLVEFFFILFAVLFLFTRLYVYPAYLLHSVWYHAPKQYGPWPLHIVFFLLLATLFVLHIFWMYMIWKVVLSSLLSGNVRGDSRSDDEMTTDDDSRHAVVTSHAANGMHNVKRA